MTNEEAIAIIRKEYLCVGKDCNIERSCSKCDLVMPNKEPILQAYKMAMDALEQMPGLAMPTSPCDLCRYNPPSSGDGKPCTMCPAQERSEG